VRPRRRGRRRPRTHRRTPLRLSGDEGSERGRVTMPLTAGRDSGASGPGEMGRGSLPTSNGITQRFGTRFLPSRRPQQGHLGTTSCALMWFCRRQGSGNAKTPEPLSRGRGGRARGRVGHPVLVLARTRGRSRHQLRHNPARSREFPFWLTRFPTSESYPAIAGRTLRTRLGWVVAEVELHGSLMPTPAVRLRWPFRIALGAAANRRPLPR
jgi:hypothetical protein